MTARIAGLALAMSACGDDAPVSDAAADVGPDVGGDAGPEIEAPTPPAAAALPTMTPCPEGWQSTMVGPAEACEPWPPDTAPCTFPETRFPGDASCARLGSACPAPGEWPSDLPTDGSVLYVRAGAAGGDGSLDAPFGLLTDALAAAAAGATIALTEGSYGGDVFVPDDVALRGACVARTELVGPTGDVADATVVLGPSSSLRDLHIRGDRAGVVMNGGGSANLRDIWIEGVAIGIGLVGSTTRLDGEGIVVDGIEPREAGFGIYVGTGSQASLSRVHVTNVVGGSVVVGNDGSRLTLTDAVIQNAVAPEDTALGTAISSLSRGHLELTRALVDGAMSSGVFVQGEASAQLVDVVVRNIRTMGTRGQGAFGVGVQSASRADVERLYVSATEASGIVAIGFRTELVGSDIIVDAVGGTMVAGLTGTGILVDTASMNIERALVRDARNAGVTVSGLDGQGTFSDLTVMETRPESGLGYGGVGLDVVVGGVVAVARAHFVDNQDAGVLVSGPTSSAALSDIVVTETRPDDDGRYGRGLSAQAGATLDAERIVVTDNIEVGVFVHGEGPGVTLRDAVIGRTAVSEVSGAAMGLVAVEMGQVDIERFLIEDNALAGIQIATGGRIRARVGVVSGSPIGVNVQTPGIDPNDLSDRVLYIDNDQNLDASELPVPGASVAE